MESSSKLSALFLLAILLTPQVLACQICPPSKPKPTPKGPKPSPKGPILPPVIGKPPITVPPITVPPIPPITVPPIVAPPITVPPITVPPVVAPPITVPPVTVPPIVKPPITVPPITVPPITLPPVPVVTPILPPVTGGTPAPKGGTPAPKGGCPTPAAPPATCPVDTVKLGACLDILGAINAHLGDPAVECCPIIEGLVATEAALCFCTTIKFKLLDVNVFLPIALNFLVTCGKTPPPGYTCP